LGQDVTVFDPWLSHEKLGFGPVGSDEQAARRAAAKTAASASVRERDMARSSVWRAIHGGCAKMGVALRRE
jgi:hypothetical protein